MTDVVSDPTSLTKDKLKKELMKRNVTLPATDKRKDVYVQLYREHVLGNLASFSSDEEDSFGGSKLTQRKSKPGSPRKSTSKKSSASSAAMDPFKLSDEELKDELNKRGVNAGPILDSTRKVYQRKLDRLLKEAPAKAEPVVVLAEEEEEEEEFSESEVEPEPETQVKQIVEPKVDSIRKRQTRDSPKPPSRTLTPRRSTRIEAEKPPSVKVVNDVVIEERKVAPPPPRTDTVTRQPERNSGTTTAPVPKKRAFSIKVQLAILVIVALVIFFVITKMEPSYRNPLRRAVSGGSGEV